MNKEITFKLRRIDSKSKLQANEGTKLDGVIENENTRFVSSFREAKIIVLADGSFELSMLVDDSTKIFDCSSFIDAYNIYNKILTKEEESHFI